MIELPELTRDVAAAVTIVAKRLPATVPFGGGGLLARFGVSAPPGDWRCAFGRLGGVGFTLRFDPLLLPAAAPWPASDGLPNDLLAILHGVLLTEVASAIEELAGEAPEWVGADAAQRPHRFGFDRPDGRAVAEFATDDAGLAWLARRLARLPVLEGPLDELPVTARVLCDRLHLTPAELAALTPGDVVLLVAEPAALILSLPGGRAWSAALQGGRLNLNAALDALMSEPEGLPPDTLDALPLTVECEVGRLTLTLAQLRGLAPGEVLELGDDATGAVALRVNGQVVAVGELVRIAGRTGIRLTEVRTGRPL